MTKEEYAETRDAFAEIVHKIDDLLGWAFSPYAAITEDEEYDDFLDRTGYYMTGSDFRAVQYAKEIFETLAGRNAARAL